MGIYFIEGRKLRLGNDDFEKEISRMIAQRLKLRKESEN